MPIFYEKIKLLATNDRHKTSGGLGAFAALSLAAVLVGGPSEAARRVNPQKAEQNPRLKRPQNFFGYFFSYKKVTFNKKTELRALCFS
ncbi:MAG: hypothetical protein WC480_04925 [Patescibacteria group bacterium]